MSTNRRFSVINDSDSKRRHGEATCKAFNSSDLAPAYSVVQHSGRETVNDCQNRRLGSQRPKRLDEAHSEVESREKGACVTE